MNQGEIIKKILYDFKIQATDFSNAIGKKRATLYLIYKRERLKNKLLNDIVKGFERFNVDKKVIQGFLNAEYTPVNNKSNQKNSDQMEKRLQDKEMIIELLQDQLKQLKVENAELKSKLSAKAMSA
jgi:hypothetical protein